MSRSRSGGQKLWYPRKGLVIRNIHVKYQSPSTVESRYYVVNFSTQKKRNTGANAINVCLCFQSIKIVKLLILNVEGRVLIISY